MQATASVNIYTEQTPNPATMKFLTTKLLVNNSIDFPNQESAQDSPFAKELFKFSFVKGVFFASNFVTITKEQDIEWEDITEILKEFIKGAIESEQKITTEVISETQEFVGTDTEKKIQQVLEDYVRPAVEQDGGAIHYKSFDNGIVTVILKGACSGCPSSTITLKSGIENLLKRMVPGVTEVVSQAM